MAPISKNVVDESQLFISERPLEPLAKQLGKPDDRMQRCSKLVAHAGKEFALELVRCFHLAVPKLQLAIGGGQFSRVLRLQRLDLFFRLYAVRDIPDNCSDPKSLLRFERTETYFHRKACTVLALALQQ